MGSNSADVMAAKFASWLMIDSQLHAILDDMATSAAADVLDLIALRRHFDRWSRWLYAASEMFLFAHGSSVQAITAYSAAVIGVPDVWRFECFHLFDWENFIARVRLAVLRSHPQRRRPTDPHPLSPPSVHHHHQGITGVWRCPRLPHVELVGRTGSFDPLSLPITTVLVFWQQLRDIHLQFDSQKHTLEIQADRNSSQDHDVTRLVLDGRLRTFNVLPHGESTLCAGAIAGGQCFGDYVGTALDQDAVRGVCNSWPTEVWARSRSSLYQRPYRWEWQLHLSEADALEMTVRVAVGAMDGTGLDDFACKRVTERLALVSSWRDV